MRCRSVQSGNGVGIIQQGTKRYRDLAQRDVTALTADSCRESEFFRWRIKKQNYGLADAISVAQSPQTCPFPDGEDLSGSSPAQSVGHSEADAHHADLTCSCSALPLDGDHRAGENHARLTRQLFQFLRLLTIRRNRDAQRNHDPETTFHARPPTRGLKRKSRTHSAASEPQWPVGKKNRVPNRKALFAQAQIRNHDWSGADKCAPPSKSKPERKAQKMSVTEIENGP